MFRKMKVLYCLGMMVAGLGDAQAASGWLKWRGDAQVGWSDAGGLPEDWVAGGQGELWSIRLAGRGTPVVADGVLYAMGYRGEGAALREVLVAVDAETGEAKLVDGARLAERWRVEHRLKALRRCGAKSVHISTKDDAFQVLHQHFQRHARNR